MGASALVRRLLPESMMRSLRGDYNSVINRFVSIPSEFLVERIVQLFGGNYIEWYGKRLDRSLAHRSGAQLLGKAYFETGADDLALLVKFGLAPGHTLFELGTGEGRTAQHIVAYLDPGHFTGNDSSSQRVRRFEEYFAAKGLVDRKARVLFTQDNLFDWLEGATFDFLWSNAVVNHMPDADVRTLFSNLPKAMHDKSVALIVFSQLEGRPETYRYTVKDWFRGPQFYMDLARDAGLDAEDISEHLPFGAPGYFRDKPLGGLGRLRYRTNAVKLSVGGSE